MGRLNVGPMRTELPAERLRRRLGADPATDDEDDDEDTDPNSLLPRWVPDGSPGDDGWLAKVRADPGRAGAIALAAVAAIGHEKPGRVAPAGLVHRCSGADQLLLRLPTSCSISRNRLMKLR